MANISSNLVVLRNKKKREKRSIYSRYFKEFSFKTSPGPDSLPCELVSMSSNRNLNISNKTADTAAVRARPGGMSRTGSYADQVRELLRNDPLTVDTLDRIRQPGLPPLPSLPPSVEIRSTPRSGRPEADQTSTSQQLGQLAPRDKSTRKVYVRNTSGAEPVITSKLSTFSSVISR